MDRGIGIQELRDFKVAQQEVIGKECYAVRYGLDEACWKAGMNLVYTFLTQMANFLTNRVEA